MVLLLLIAMTVFLTIVIHVEGVNWDANKPIIMENKVVTFILYKFYRLFLFFYDLFLNIKAIVSMLLT